MSRYSTTTFNKNVVVAKTSYQILEVLQLILRSGEGLTSSNEDFWWKKSTMKHFILFFFFIESVQWKYIFSNNTTVCVSYVKPVKQITFLWHSITITSAHAVITKDYPSWQAFEREGKGSFRRERNARGTWSRALIPFLFPFPFERLPHRLTKDRLKVISLSTSS